MLKWIREVHRPEIKKIVNLEKAAFGNSGADEWTLVPLLRHGRVFAYYQEEQLIGEAQFLKDWDQPATAYLYSVAVERKWHGKGIGTRFLQECFAHLAAEGIQRIELTVDPANEAALKVYRDKLGFTVTGYRENEYGEHIHRYVMLCRI